MHIFMPFTPGTRFAARMLSHVMLGFDQGGLPPPPLQPMSQFPPSPPTPPRTGGNVLIGLGIGLIPLLVAMVGLGGAINTRGDTANAFFIVLVIGGVLYLAQIITGIIFTVLQRFRLVGTGMLIMVAINPVVFFIGCVALLSRGFGSA